jgi:hypothetical protein
MIDDIAADSFGATDEPPSGRSYHPWPGLRQRGTLTKLSARVSRRLFPQAQTKRTQI